MLGWQAGLVTLFADIAKGFTPSLLAVAYFDSTVAFFVGVTAIVGHVFPVWLKFKGGKGIATGLGVVLALQPVAALIGAGVYILSCLVTKVSSYSSMIGLVAIAAAGIILAPNTWWYYLAFFLIALYTLRHNFTGRVPNYDT